MIDKANDPTVGVGDETAEGGEGPAVSDAGEGGNEDTNGERVSGECG